MRAVEEVVGLGSRRAVVYVWTQGSDSSIVDKSSHGTKKEAKMEKVKPTIIMLMFWISYFKCSDSCLTSIDKLIQTIT